MKDEKTNVIVVGGGTAAFEAAVTAKQSGAERVVILEKAPESEFGGNARFSHTGFRWVHAGAAEIREFVPEVDESEFQRMHIPPYTNEHFMGDLKRVTQGRINHELAEILVGESNAAVHWMHDVGIQWELDRYVNVDGRYYFSAGVVIHPKGGIEGGFGQLLQWREIATRMKIEIRYESRVCAPRQ